MHYAKRDFAEIRPANAPNSNFIHFYVTTVADSYSYSVIKQVSNNELTVEYLAAPLDHRKG